MNVGDPTRKIPAFEEIYSREEQEYRSSGVAESESPAVAVEQFVGASFALRSVVQNVS
jgi:hypothetical protein